MRSYLTGKIVISSTPRGNIHPIYEINPIPKFP